MTCPETTTIGAYVLGALDASERRAIERHLETCPVCRETLLQFAPLPGLLHSVPLEDLEATPVESWILAVEPPIPPIEIHDSAPRPRRWRRVLAGAVALIVLGVVGVVGWQGLQGPSSQSATWTATNGVGGIDTTAKLTSHGWGTDIKLSLSDLKPGEQCTLVVHGRDGTVETAGWWATPTTYHADVPASTSIPLHDIDRLEVVTAGNTVLSTVSPATR